MTTSLFVKRNASLQEFNQHGENTVYGFFGTFRFLSNFHHASFEYKGETFMSSEHAYMWAKTDVPEEKAAILNALTAKESKRLGSICTLRSNWDDIRLEAMEGPLRCKFAPGRDEHAMLMMTQPAILVEANWWGDRFWGECKGTGENNLGKILMKIRDDKP